MSKAIGDVPIIVEETMVIREAIRMATHLHLENIIVESDLQIAIN